MQIAVFASTAFRLEELLFTVLAKGYEVRGDIFALG
jgi:hypothetical protein